MYQSLREYQRINPNISKFFKIGYTISGLLIFNSVLIIIINKK